MAVCRNCGEDNPERARLCMMCGTGLAEAPRERAEERKVVSILFVDLVGFSARSHDADPEDVRAALTLYHQCLKREIEAFGGTVEKFIGDAVMAVFGAPVAHEDDAERAVRAALRIMEAIEALNKEADLDLSIRAAVNTGEGLVNLSARPQAGEGMVTGDVVNTASRLQGVAPVNGVVVGEMTYRSTKNLIVYDELEPVVVKGKPDPVPLWRTVSARGRFGVDVEPRYRTPFIGRDFDLATLKASYQRTLRESTLQLVTLVGEPGIGKSRLLAEFASYVDEQPELVTWRQGRSLPYGEGITFWALGEIIKAHSGILESDSREAASAKLRIGVEAVVEKTDERTWLATRLGPLVGATAAHSGGGVDRDQSFTAWRRFLEAVAAAGPLIVAFEDLHWANTAMLEFIDHLVEWSTGVPLLVICTARPELYEAHEGWGGGKRNSNTISLSALSYSETAQLISSLLSQAVLPAEVHAALLERAGGNPLYAEEFIRMLSDRGALERKYLPTIDPDADISMPDNVQALIAARLDTLSAERKAILHDASVAGKVFWLGAVIALGGRDDREVRERLHELSQKELVRPARNSSMEGEKEYSFWHALVREVAYSQIPRAPRARKHRALAEWIEHVAGSRVRDHAAVLSHHYQEALLLARACGLAHESEELKSPTIRFLILAGDRAMFLDVAKARLFYKNALRYLSTNDPRRANVTLSLARASQRAGELKVARGLFESAITQFSAQGDARRAGAAMHHLSELLWLMGNVSEGATLVHKAIEVLEPQGPGVELALAYSLQSAYETISKGRPQKGLQFAEKALAIAERIDNPETVMQVLGNRGLARGSMGDPAGTEDLWESVRLGKELGLGAETSGSYSNLAAQVGSLAGPGAAITIGKESLDFARSRGLRAEEMWMEGENAKTLYLLGEWDQALQQIKRVMKWSEENEALMLKGVALNTRVKIALSRGEAPVVATLSELMLQHARSIGEPQIVLPALVVAAEAARMRGDERSARRLIEEFAAALCAHPLLGSEDLPDAVRLSVALGATETAAAMVKTVEKAYSTPFSKRYLQAARAVVAEALSLLEEGLSLHKEAEQRWEELGMPMERGHSLLGVGRSLIALGFHESAIEPLGRARAIFSRLSAGPLVNETETFLQQAQAAS